eukprot:g2741.t1
MTPGLDIPPATSLVASGDDVTASLNTHGKSAGASVASLDGDTKGAKAAAGSSLAAGCAVLQAALSYVTGHEAELLATVCPVSPGWRDAALLHIAVGYFHSEARSWRSAFDTDDWGPRGLARGGGQLAWRRLQSALLTMPPRLSPVTPETIDDADEQARGSQAYTAWGGCAPARIDFSGTGVAEDAGGPSSSSFSSRAQALADLFYTRFEQAPLDSGGVGQGRPVVLQGLMSDWPCFKEGEDAENGKKAEKQQKDGGEDDDAEEEEDEEEGEEEGDAAGEEQQRVRRQKRRRWSLANLAARFGEEWFRFDDLYGEEIRLRDYIAYAATTADDSPLAIYDSQFGEPEDEPEDEPEEEEAETEYDEEEDEAEDQEEAEEECKSDEEKEAGAAAVAVNKEEEEEEDEAGEAPPAAGPEGVPSPDSSYGGAVKKEEQEEPEHVEPEEQSTPRMAMVAEYRVPAVFDCDLFAAVGNGFTNAASRSSRPPYRWVLMGPERSGTGMHIDPLQTSAWVALIEGRKRWCLFPPDTDYDLCGFVPKDGPAKPEAVHWFLRNHPAAAVTAAAAPRRGKADKADKADTAGNKGNKGNHGSGVSGEWPAGLKGRVVEVLQHPGEIVFVPAGWMHVVVNLEFTVSVTHNYASPHGPVAATWRECATVEPDFAKRWWRFLNLHLRAVDAERREMAAAAVGAKTQEDASLGPGQQHRQHQQHQQHWPQQHAQQQAETSTGRAYGSLRGTGNGAADPEPHYRAALATIRASHAALQEAGEVDWGLESVAIDRKNLGGGNGEGEGEDEDEESDDDDMGPIPHIDRYLRSRATTVLGSASGGA